MVVRQLWTPTETDLLSRALRDTLREARGGAEFDGSDNEVVHNFWDVNDVRHRTAEGTTGVAEAAFVEADPRVLSKVEQILGPGFEPSWVRTADHSPDGSRG